MKNNGKPSKTKENEKNMKLQMKRKYEVANEKNEVENEKNEVWWQKVMNENEKNERIMKKNDIQIYPTKWHENTDQNENEKNVFFFWWSQSVAVRIL